MKNKLRILAIVGLFLNIVGTLLPWGCAGWACTPGISFPTPYLVDAQDNGGFLVLFLTLTASALIFYKPGFLRKARLFAAVSAALLLVIIAFHTGRWVLLSFQIPGECDSEPAIGLAILLVGSSVLLLAARDFYKATIN